MLSLYDDPNYEDVQTCHLFAALEAAMQIQKKKIIVGPNDSVGILLFNTVRLKLCEALLFLSSPIIQDQKVGARPKPCLRNQEKHVRLSTNHSAGCAQGSGVDTIA